MSYGAIHVFAIGFMFVVKVVPLDSIIVMQNFVFGDMHPDPTGRP